METFAHEVTSLAVRLVREGNKVRAHPVKANGQTSVKLYVKPDTFKQHRARLGEIWEATVDPATGLAELQNRISSELITAIPGHWIDADTLFCVQVLLANREHVCFVGPPGCGKTSLMERLSRAKGWTYVQIDCGTKQAVRDWFGMDAADKGSTFHAESRFVKILREAGEHPENTYAFGFDELNRVQGVLHNSLLSLLSDQRQVEIPTVEGTKIISVPVNVLFMATRNDEQKNTGAFVLDSAMRNRFQMVEISFMPELEEVNFLVRETNVAGDSAMLIMKVANEIRGSITNRAFIAPMPSPRDTRRAALLAGRGKSVRFACEFVFLADLDGSRDRPTTVKGKVLECINKIIPLPMTP